MQRSQYFEAFQVSYLSTVFIQLLDRSQLSQNHRNTESDGKWKLKANESNYKQGEKKRGGEKFFENSDVNWQINREKWTNMSTQSTQPICEENCCLNAWYSHLACLCSQIRITQSQDRDMQFKLQAVSFENKLVNFT